MTGPGARNVRVPRPSPFVSVFAWPVTVGDPAGMPILCPLTRAVLALVFSHRREFGFFESWLTEPVLAAFFLESVRPEVQVSERHA